MGHSESRSQMPSVPHTRSQEDPSIPTLSLTDEDGSSCPIYTPEQTTMTPLQSVQADSQLDNGYPDSIESPSLGRKPFFNSNPYTTSEMSLDNLVADEDLSSDQSDGSIQDSIVNHDRPLDDDMDWDNDILRNTGTEFIDDGSLLEDEPRNTPGGK